MKLFVFAAAFVITTGSSALANPSSVRNSAGGHIKLTYLGGKRVHGVSYMPGTQMGANEADGVWSREGGKFCVTWSGGWTGHFCY